MQPELQLDDLLDRLVAEFSDQLNAGGNPVDEEFLQRIPDAHRPALARCLRTIRAGIATVPTKGRALAPGVVLDGYRIERELGRGGMATVYFAEELELRRMVALKVLRPGLAVDGRHVDRFRREALAVAKVQHPHIVQIHAVGEADGYHYLAMEYVDGGSLADVIAQLPTDEEWTAAHLADATGLDTPKVAGRSYESALAELMTPVARAVAVAHELGLVHRDIKPSNILLHKDGRAKVADFGLAKGSEDPALSMTGEPLGTPYYMSPEQAEMKHHRVDERSDIYSLGVSIYECLTGARPFEGETALAVLDAIRQGNPTPLRLRAPRRTRAAEAVVRRAMAHRKEDRYATAIDLAADLAALAEGRPTQALVHEGGPVRRFFAGCAQIWRGQGLEYVSPRKFLGLPLVHINYRLRRPGEGLRKARGWIAMSDYAVGGIALGPFAIGVLAIGSMALGLLSLAGFALGGYAIGGMGVGVMANGGMAVGYAAAGGIAAGYYTLGGLSYGVHDAVVLNEQGQMVLNPVAEDLFETWMPWVVWLLER